MQRALRQLLSRELDGVTRLSGFSRNAVCRSAGVDASTMWRATRRGRVRNTTLTEYMEALFGMTIHQGSDLEAFSAPGAREIWQVCNFLADRRGGADGAAQLAALEAVRSSPEFLGLYGARGQAFVELAASEAGPGELSVENRGALFMLGLALLADIKTAARAA